MSFIIDGLRNLAAGYAGFIDKLPVEMGLLIQVFIFSILIAFYAIFSYNFYRFISKKDLLSLNLNQYNTSDHPVMYKFLASVFYLLEYIVILPFLIFFWFAVLAMIIFVLSEESAQHVIVVSAAIIVAIRMLAYYSDDLAKDLAKMFPFIVLTIFVLQQQFFNIGRIVENIAQLGESTTIIAVLYFFILIITVEFILRFVDLGRGFWESEDERPVRVKTNNI